MTQIKMAAPLVQNYIRQDLLGLVSSSINFEMFDEGPKNLKLLKIVYVNNILFYLFS